MVFPGVIQEGEIKSVLTLHLLITLELVTVVLVTWARVRQEHSPNHQGNNSGTCAQENTSSEEVFF